MIDEIDHSYQDFIVSHSTGNIRYTEKDGIVMLPVKQRPYAANFFAYGFLILIIASFLVAWKR